MLGCGQARLRRGYRRWWQGCIQSPLNRVHPRHQGERHLWIGWVEEVPGVNCQERTREALLETLKITLREALEMKRQDARSAAGDDLLDVKIAV